MIRWYNLVVAGSIAWASLGVSFAPAQGQIGGYTPPIQQRPTVSPYLNLNRPGTNPAINYFDLVRPQVQTQQQLQNLQVGQTALATGTYAATAQVAPLNQPLPPHTTGHPVAYFDYSRYFPLGGLPNTFGGANAGFGATGYAAPGLRTGIGAGFAAPR